MVVSIEVMLLPAVVSAVAPTASSATLPTQRSFFLTSGFDYSRGAKPPAVELPSLCSVSTSGACIDVTEAEEATIYTSNVESREDHSDLMKSVTKAEGGGWGVTVSTGVEAIGTSKTSEASFSFFVGKSATTQERVIRNPLKLKLTSEAQGLLEANPLQFLETYGQHYMFSMTFGGSFLGSFSMTERHSSRTSDLDVFAEVDAKTVFFKAEASTDFEQKSSDASSRVESKANVKFRGGNVETNTSSPAALGRMFSAWEQSMIESPDPLTMTVRSWMDCEQVQNIVNSKPADVQEAFRAQPIAPVTTETLSEETGKLFLLADSLVQALEWTEVKTNATLKNQLRDLQDRAKAHQLACQTLSEVDVLLRQVEIKGNNFAWFIADKLTDEFEDIKARLPPPPVVQIVNPISAKCLDINGAGYFQDGTQVQLWTCLGNPNQQWEFKDGQVVNPPSGKCLDLDGAGGFEDMTKVQLWTCLGNPNQRWEFREGQVVHLPSGKCLDLDGAGGFEDGTKAQLWTCLGNPNQQWAVRDAVPDAELDAELLV